jgi:hypothetical protein
MMTTCQGMLDSTSVPHPRPSEWSRLHPDPISSWNSGTSNICLAPLLSPSIGWPGRTLTRNGIGLALFLGLRQRCASLSLRLSRLLTFLLVTPEVQGRFRFQVQIQPSSSSLPVPEATRIARGGDLFQ